MSNIVEIKLEVNIAISNLKEKFLTDAAELMNTVQKSKDIDDEDKIYIIDSLFKFCKEIDIDFNDCTELKKLQVFIKNIEPFENQISIFKKIHRIFKHTLKITFNTIIILFVSFVTIGLSYKYYEVTLDNYRKYLYFGYDFVEEILYSFILISYLTMTNVKFWYDTMNYIIRNSLFSNLKSLCKEICSLFNIKYKIKIPKDAVSWFNNIAENTSKTLNKIDNVVFKEKFKPLRKQTRRHSRKCKQNEILNPTTNRCVKKNGKIGKLLSEL